MVKTRTKKLVVLLLFVALAAPAAALAFQAKSGDSVSVAKNETVDGNLYAAGASLSIDGKVNGDVICAGASLNVNGEVAGDVICAAQSVNVNGKIGGNLRVAASSINLNGQVGRNATLAASSLNTSASSTVGWEMLFGAATADLRGRIGRDLTGAGANAVLAGNFGRNVRLWLDNNKRADRPLLKIEKGAVIGGKLTYTAKTDAAIDQGAKIAGEIKRNEPRVREVGRRQAAAVYLFGSVYSIFAAIVIGLVLLGLWSEEVKKVIGNLSGNARASFGWGLVALIVTPVLGLLLLITLIGIPLALLLMMAWIAALILSKIFVGILVGQKLLERFWQAKKDSLFAALIIGVAVSYLIFALPFFGWLASFLALIWGLGAIYLYFQRT